MPFMMLSTVGTSLLNNALPQERRGRVIKLANATEANIGADDRAFLDEAAALARARLAEADPTERREVCKRLSAELNGILTHEDELKAPERTHHILFATDTYAGKLAAELLKGWLIGQKHSVETFVASCLRTNSLAEFRDALARAVPEIVQRINDYRDSHYNVLFNLTGGFKGVQGFMQALAMLHGVESVYVFESGSELMRIPRLPIGAAGDEIVQRNFALFQTMASGKEVAESDVRAAGIPETMLFILDGQAVLSEWGKTIWSEVWTKAASAELLESPDPRIAFTLQFERDVKRFPNRLRQINEAILSLAQWLDGEDRYQGRYKIQKYDTRRPSTHELYGWTDQDAGRIFFQMKDGKAILHELIEHPKE